MKIGLMFANGAAASEPDRAVELAVELAAEDPRRQRSRDPRPADLAELRRRGAARRLAAIMDRIGSVLDEAWALRPASR